MTDRNVLWRIANSTNIRARQRNNATITDADIQKMHYFQQAQATGQRAQFYHQYVLPSQGGLPRDYDFQIAAMEFKIEQEHVNSENQLLAPQQLKENIETKMEISTKNDIIGKINKLVESLSSLLNEQSIATTKIYTVFKEYNNLSQYYNNYVNEIANDVQFRGQFINKVVQLEDLFSKLFTEVSDYITTGHTKPDLKVVSMGQVEAILKDIMKTLTLMLDVKPTTPFVNDTTGLAFGQTKARDGDFRQPINMGEQIDDQGESKYLETDALPNFGFTEDEIRQIEEGHIDEEGQQAMYDVRENEAKTLMEDYVNQQNRIRQGVDLNDGEAPIQEEDVMAAIYDLRIDPKRQKELWVEVSRALNGVLPSFEGARNNIEDKAKIIMRNYLSQQADIANGTADGQNIVLEKTVNKQLRRMKITPERLSTLWAEAKRELSAPKTSKLSPTEKRTTALTLLYDYVTALAVQFDSPDAMRELTKDLSVALEPLNLSTEEVDKLHAQAVQAVDDGIPKSSLFSTSGKEIFREKQILEMKNNIRQYKLDTVDANADQIKALDRKLEMSRQKLKITPAEFEAIAKEIDDEGNDDGNDEGNNEEGDAKNPNGLHGSKTAYLVYISELNYFFKNAYGLTARLFTIQKMFVALNSPEMVHYYNTYYQPHPRKNKPDIRSLVTAPIIAHVQNAFNLDDDELFAVNVITAAKPFWHA